MCPRTAFFLFVIESESMTERGYFGELNIFFLRCVGAGVKNLLRYLFVGVRCALCVVNELLKVVIGPIIRSSVIIDVIINVGWRTTGRNASGHEEMAKNKMSNG